MKYGDTQSPDRVLADHPLSKDLFEKIYEIDADKFKIVKPTKHNCGLGRVSIHKRDIGEGSKKITIFKVVFKNVIGKTLYDGNISGTSRIRKVPEKAYKNQLKIAVVSKVEKKENEEKKMVNEAQFCQINFKRSDDLEAFFKHFE